MSKTLLVALALSSVIACPALAQQREKPIVVESRPTSLTQWSQGFSIQLERKLRYPEPMGNEPTPSGIVSVRFQCSADGKPAGIVLHRKSGSRALDKAAMWAVSHIKSLHPMPPGMKSDQKFEANILFARDWSDHQRQIDALKSEAAQRNAWFKGDQDAPVIAFSVGAGVPGRSR